MLKIICWHFYVGGFGRVISWIGLTNWAIKTYIKSNFWNFNECKWKEVTHKQNFTAAEFICNQNETHVLTDRCTNRANIHSDRW